MGEEGRRIACIIRTGSRKMDELIVGLLEFSRVGRTALKRDLMDMTLLADAAAIEAKSLHVSPEPLIEIGDLPGVEGDVTVMRQVWLNLIGNALKYSAKRSQPHVKITGWVDLHEAIYQVEDNGAGIRHALRRQLFGVFQRCTRIRRLSRDGCRTRRRAPHHYPARRAYLGARAPRTRAPALNSCFRYVRRFPLKFRRAVPMTCLS